MWDFGGEKRREVRNEKISNCITFSDPPVILVFEISDEIFASSNNSGGKEIFGIY